jgi:hypothetical protein
MPSNIVKDVKDYIVFEILKAIKSKTFRGHYKTANLYTYFYSAGKFSMFRYIKSYRKRQEDEQALVDKLNARLEEIDIYSLSYNLEDDEF